MPNQETTLPDGTWTLDPDATTVDVSVKKMKVMTVTARLDVDAGTITVADGAITGVNVSADATSYTSPNAKRNEHISGPDFLDSGAHPTITFTAEGADGTSRVAGTVTIKGKATPITFTVSDLNVTNNSASFTASTTVDRFALGVDKLPAFVIAKELDIAVTASAKLAA